MRGYKVTMVKKLVFIFSILAFNLLPMSIFTAGLQPWCDTVTPVCPNLSQECHPVSGIVGAFPYKSYSDVPNMTTKKCIGHTEPDPHCKEKSTYCRTRTYWSQPNCTGFQYPKWEDYSNTTC